MVSHVCLQGTCKARRLGSQMIQSLLTVSTMRAHWHEHVRCHNSSTGRSTYDFAAAKSVTTRLILWGVAVSNSLVSYVQAKVKVKHLHEGKRCAWLSLGIPALETAKLHSASIMALTCCV